MSVHIDDLSFDLLKYIVEFLPDKQLFLVERVSKKWQKCVRKTLAQKKSLARLEHYSKEFKYRINDNNIDILKSILKKCNNVKHLDFLHTKVTGKNNLVAIANLCPKLESINLRNSSFDVSKQEIEEFGKMIGPQLRRCKFTIRSCNNLMIIFKQLKNIEEIYIESETIEQANQIFDHLNIKCNNLQVLEWFPDDFNIHYQNDNMINVIQRIQHLNVDLRILSKFKFQMNNLNELTIRGGDHCNFIEKTFENLTKLNITHFFDKNFDSISKFKSPKLESVSINYSADIPSSFIRQIKNIKSLYYYCGYCFSSSIPQLTNLTDLVLIWHFGKDKYSEALQGFDVLSKHKTLQNIKLGISDDEFLIDNDFYDKLASLCHAKPNTEIIIATEEYKSGTEQYINYKKIFEEAKRLHKLNIKLSLYFMIIDF